MLRFPKEVGLLLLPLSLAACGTGDVIPNGAEAVDCTQDDAYELSSPWTGTMGLAVQDRTFQAKRTDNLVPEGAFVTTAVMPSSRCGEADNQAQRLWTVSQYTRWGHGITAGLPGPPPTAGEWEGISFWAKALVDLDRADDKILLTGSGYESPRLKPVDPADPTSEMVPESEAEFFARKPKTVRVHGAVRAQVGYPPTSSENCVAVTPPEPPPLQVQDGSDECYDSFSSVVLPPARWKFFTLPFVEMRQAGWGKPVRTLDAAGINGLTITLGPFADYDVLIDDITFYRRKKAAP